MKVLTFKVDGEVYILGTPDYNIAEFDNVGEIAQIFKTGLKLMSTDKSDLAMRINEAFSFVLKSDPRVQELNALSELVSRGLVPSTATAVLVALKEYNNFIVMSLFKTTDKAKEWHQMGDPFVLKSKLLDISNDSFKAFRNLLKKVTPKEKDSYISPRLAKLDVAPYKYIPASEEIH